ncbi:MAG TPA: HEAT repeat domain-containing protein [Candidatus Wallbacteria bacterium]|nr:HEAT repeat domain-containing protein [Candidatus Wallbacteria bacterium]
MALPAEVVKLLEDLKSAKEETRKKAVITLGRYNLPEVKASLSELTNDASTAVRYFAKKALKDFESMTAANVEHSGGFDLNVHSPAPASHPSAPSMDSVMKEEAFKKPVAPPPADLFGSGGGSLTKILNDLKSPDENVKIEAIKQLGEKKEVVATEPLLGLIHDPVKSVRLYAVQSLGLIGENRVLTPLLNLLNSEQDAFVVATLVKAIARVGGAQLIPIIARYLKDPDARTRANTIEALEIIGDPKIIKFLIPLLQDENNRVKANSIKVLSKFGKTNMFEKLDEMLQSDDISIRGSAIYALSAIGGEQVIELLEKAKNDEDPSNLKKLAEGLAKINTERSLELLRELSVHPDAEVSAFAMSLLGGEEEGPEAEAPFVPEPETVPVEKPQIQQAPKPIQPEPKIPQAEVIQQQERKTEKHAEPEVHKAPAVQAVQAAHGAKAQAQLRTLSAPPAQPHNFTQQDFENLWNDTLFLLNNFQKSHPDFSKDKMAAFLRSLETVLE